MQETRPSPLDNNKNKNKFSPSNAKAKIFIFYVKLKRLPVVSIVFLRTSHISTVIYSQITHRKLSISSKLLRCSNIITISCHSVEITDN